MKADTKAWLQGFVTGSIIAIPAGILWTIHTGHAGRMQARGLIEEMRSQMEDRIEEAREAIIAEPGSGLFGRAEE